MKGPDEQQGLAVEVVPERIATCPRSRDGWATAVAALPPPPTAPHPIAHQFQFSSSPAPAEPFLQYAQLLETSLWAADSIEPLPIVYDGNGVAQPTFFGAAYPSITSAAFCCLDSFRFEKHIGDGEGRLLLNASGDGCDGVEMMSLPGKKMAASFRSARYRVVPGRAYRIRWELMTRALVPLQGGLAAGAPAMTGGIYLHFFDLNGEKGAFSPQHGLLAPRDTQGEWVPREWTFASPTTARSVELHITFAAHTIGSSNRMQGGTASGAATISSIIVDDIGSVQAKPSSIGVPDTKLQDAIDLAFACLHNSKLSGNFTVSAGRTLSDNISPDLTFGLMGIRRTAHAEYVERMAKQWLLYTPITASHDAKLYGRVLGPPMGQVLWPLGVDQIFSATGDREFLSSMLPAVDASLSFTHRRSKDHSILVAFPNRSGEKGQSADWVSWHHSRRAGRTLQFHLWYLQALRRAAHLHNEFAMSFGNSSVAAEYEARAMQLEQVLRQVYWRGDHWKTNLDHPDAGEWVDDSVWSIFFGVADKKQAQQLWGKMSAFSEYYESVPTRWGSGYFHSCSWFGRLGAGDILARYRSGQYKTAAGLLMRISRAVVSAGNFYEGIDTQGCGLKECGCSAGGFGDYLEHCAGFLWAVSEGLFGLDLDSTSSRNHSSSEPEWDDKFDSDARIDPRFPRGWHEASTSVFLRGGLLNVSWSRPQLALLWSGSPHQEGVRIWLPARCHQGLRPGAKGHLVTLLPRKAQTFECSRKLATRPSEQQKSLLSSWWERHVTELESRPSTPCLENQRRLLCAAARALDSSFRRLCGSNAEYLRPVGFQRLSDDGLAASRVTGVLPAVMSQIENLRFFLASCQPVFTRAKFDAVWIVVPTAELLQIWHQLSASIPSHWMIVSEDALGSDSQEGCEFSGWLKQQDAKLSIARFVCTRNYLVLDADVMCNARDGSEFTLERYMRHPVATMVTKEAPSNRLSHEQNQAVARIATCMEVGPHFRSSFWGVNSGNFENTARVLKLHCNASKFRSVMGFTPQLLSRDGVKDMAMFLEKTHGMPWLEFLRTVAPSRCSPCRRQLHGPRCEDRPFWTEFFAYELVLAELGRWDHYHTKMSVKECKNERLSMHSSSGNVLKARKNRRAFFLVEDDSAISQWQMTKVYRAVVQEGTRLHPTPLPRGHLMHLQSPHAQMRADVLSELPYAAIQSPFDQGGMVILLESPRAGASLEVIVAFRVLGSEMDNQMESRFHVLLDEHASEQHQAPNANHSVQMSFAMSSLTACLRGMWLTISLNDTVLHLAVSKERATTQATLDAGVILRVGALPSGLTALQDGIAIRQPMAGSSAVCRLLPVIYTRTHNASAQDRRYVRHPPEATSPLSFEAFSNVSTNSSQPLLARTREAKVHIR